MITVHFYDPTTGEISPQSFTGPAYLVACNTPEGLKPIEGVTNWLTQRVDVSTRGLIACQPVAPEPTEWADWRWSDAVGGWEAVPTPAGLARELRSERDRRLSACDWIVMRSSERGEPVPEAWLRYRQALRDITEQADWPAAVTWPEAPCN